MFKEKNIQDKKGYYSFLKNLQSIISLHSLKLALNKSMGASDDEQGINKLRPNIGRISFKTRGTNRLGIISQKFREFSFAAEFKVEYFDKSYGSSYEFHEIYFKQKK